MRTLLPHQREAFEWARDKKAIALFMRMRLGKSLVAIRWAEHCLTYRRLDTRYPNQPGPLRPYCQKHVLIVTPKSTIPGWQEELEKEGHSSFVIDKHTVKYGVSSHRYVNKYWLINPEFLVRHPEILEPEFWEGGLNEKVLILDESVFIRSPKARITKLLLKSGIHWEYRAILTGEPAPEVLYNYFTQMKFIMGEERWMGCKNFYQFRENYFFQGGFKWHPKKGVKQRIAKQVAKDAFVRDEHDVGIHMEKVYEKRYCTMPAPFKKLYRQAEEDFCMGEETTKWAIQVSHWLSQLAGGGVPLGYSSQRKMCARHKLDLLVELLETELKGQQVVVFCRYTREIRRILADLNKRKANCRSEPFWGFQSREERGEVVKRFNRGKTRVLVVQGKSAKYGLNLSNASTAIFYSNHWDWETRSQCEARIQHMLRKTPSLYIDLVTQGTVDEAVVKTLLNKRKKRDDFATCVRHSYNAMKVRAKIKGREDRERGKPRQYNKVERPKGTALGAKGRVTVGPRGEKEKYSSWG